MVWIVCTVLILIASVVIGIICKANDEKFSLGFFSSFVILMIINTVVNSIAYTGVCDRKVQFWLNQPQPGYVSNGLQWMMPMFDTESYDVCRRQVSFTGENTLKGNAQGVQIEVMDVVVPVRLKPDNLWRVRSLIGGEEKLYEVFYGSARSAGREVQSRFQWRDLVYNKRNEVEIALSEELSKRLTTDLMGAGLTKEEASNVFVIPEVRLRDVKPSGSILEEQANFEQALVQNDTAEVRIKTSKSDGEGINEFINNLTLKPKNVAELAQFLDAFANLERARALARISADDKRNVSVMVLQGSSPVSIPAPKQTAE